LYLSSEDAIVAEKEFTERTRKLNMDTPSFVRSGACMSPAEVKQ
jgi:hypothetical protein